MPKTPFLIIPWGRDFLECLATTLIKETNGHTGNAIVIFTHDRPRRYLIKSLQKHPDLPKPCLLPWMLTLQELLIHVRTEKNVYSYHEAGLLDQVALLYSCVQELSYSESSLLMLLSEAGEAGFFPWGVRLASLLEECLMHGLEPEDLLYTEEEVAPFGAALLAILGQIFSLYKEKLVADGLTTKGLDAYTVAEAIRQNVFETLPPFLIQKNIFLAGFNTLTGTEDVILKFLWEQGARVCLYGDGNLVEKNMDVHWACSFQSKWIESWGASTELACPPVTTKTNWHFFAGYDLHSQLQVLHDDVLLSQAEQVSTAVVLTHSELLLPVLHHLPHKQCNISLGYPLDKSLLFRMLESIIKVCELRQQDGTIYWQPLLSLIRHPYLRLLEVEGVTLYRVLQELEHKLLTGQRYVDLQRLLTSDTTCIANDKGEECIDNDLRRSLLKKVIQVTIENCVQADTPAKLADFLSELCDFLLQYGHDKWQQFPLDAECLFRLMHRVIPALKDNTMADTVLPWKLLQSMLLTLLQVERVPFEADPLTGLQVLGMLETRLLQFSQVFLVDVTDDQLPGVPMRNPLLPDSLRHVLGLPDTRNRDLLTAYTFYSLLSGVQEVYLYWQEGVEVSGFFDGKKQRSRFVEDLIWQEEQKRGVRIMPGSHLLRVSEPHIYAPLKSRRTIIKTPIIQQRLNDILSRPLSATQLDTYLLCPLRFYFERVCTISLPESVHEDDDPAVVGQLFHKVLRLFYTDYLGKECKKELISEKHLKTIFTDELLASGLTTALPPESAMMLSIAGPERLKRFLSNQPEKTKIMCLEKQFQATLTINGKIRILEGILDRVDKRSNGDIVILDYKTGRIKNIHKNVWKDEKFWSDIESMEYGGYINDERLNTIFFTLVEYIPTVQLLYYIYLYMDATGENIQDAAFISLGEDGHEHWLLKDLAIDMKEDIISNKIPSLLKFLLYHMEFCGEFFPHEGRHCNWCPWNNLCKIRVEK